MGNASKVIGDGWDGVTAFAKPDVQVVKRGRAVTARPPKGGFLDFNFYGSDRLACGSGCIGNGAQGYAVWVERAAGFGLCTRGKLSVEMEVVQEG